jgi:hypothetical protein
MLDVSFGGLTVMVGQLLLERFKGKSFASLKKELFNLA